MSDKLLKGFCYFIKRCDRVLFLQREKELEAALFAVAHGNGAGVESHSVAYDAQAEAGAATVAGAAFGDAVETLEKALEVLLGHAYACVVEKEVGVFAVVVVTFGHKTCVFAGIAQRVFGEVAEDGVEQGIVAHYHCAFGHGIDGRHPGVVEGLLQFFKNIGHHGRDVESLFGQRLGGLLGFGDKGHVAYEVGEAHHL